MSGDPHDPIRKIVRDRHSGFQLCGYFHEELKRAVEEGRGDPITESMRLEAWENSYQRGEWQRAPREFALPYRAEGHRVAVLCPGPSLTKTWPEPGYSQVIAVNRAIKLPGWADWLVAWDRDAAREFSFGARRGVLTKRASRLISTERSVLNEGIMPSALRNIALSYSKLGALVLAAWLGADEIHVFGDDMTGGTYYDGQAFDPRGRWQREEELADMVIRWLGKECNVTGKRVLSV